tara:strand:- start:104 stop:352 length:249 start_codon:yes stop_codon:yes gene_type:complete
MSTEQLEKNIAFCIDECDMDNEQVGEMLRAIETVDLKSVEYFCEEFVFVPDDCDDVMKYHDDDYFNLQEFNEFHGIYFEEEE